jgi:hypothetical protein
MDGNEDPLAPDPNQEQGFIFKLKNFKSLFLLHSFCFLLRLIVLRLQFIKIYLAWFLSSNLHFWDLYNILIVSALLHNVNKLKFNFRVSKVPRRWNNFSSKQSHTSAVS